MLVPNRHGNSSSYRYGFNGKENDNVIMGEGNFEDYGMRMYNIRIGRFPNVDPLTKSYPELTPYQFSSNSPIQNIDIDGLEGGYYMTTVPASQQDGVQRSMVRAYDKAAPTIFLTAAGILDAIYTGGTGMKILAGAGLLESMNETERGHEAAVSGNTVETHRRYVNAGEATKLAIYEGIGLLAANGVGKLAIIASKLNRGGSKLVSTTMLEKYPSSTTFGDPTETFIASSKEIDVLLSKGLSRVEIAGKLGIKNPDFLKGDLIRIDIDIPLAKELNIRNPTGTEVGANSAFVKGGKTSGGVTEKVVDGIPKKDVRVRVSKVNDKKS